MKTIQRLIVLSLVLVSLVSIFIPAYAANTEDTSFYFSFLDGSACIERRQKMDASEHYFYQVSGEVPTLKVISQGLSSQADSTGTNTTLSNGAIVPYVVCRRGTRYNVHNHVNEMGYSWAQLLIENLGAHGIVSGYWSPDSLGTYISARP